MKIGLRILLGYFVIVALAAWLLGNVFVQEVKPGVRQAMEDTLVDTANVLAELATDDFIAGRINEGRFAQRVRALRQRDIARAFEQCDVILTPTAPSAAFGIGETTDPLAMYLNDVFAVPASLAGLPAMSVPGGLDEQGLPLGLHLIGRELDEQGVLNAGLAIEERSGFTARPERWW